MEISKTHLNQDLSEQSQSEPESPLEMTVVINDSNYWTNSAGKRDFKFKVIQVRTGPKWFIWNNKADGDELSQPTSQNDCCSDQENQHESRRSMRFMSRRKVSNEANKNNELCKVTATNQNCAAPMSEPTTRRINSKTICQPNPPITSLSVSPPSTSSGCSSFSMSSSNSDTFQILSVAKKADDDQEEDDTIEETSDTNLLLSDYKSTPLILISPFHENKQ